MNTKVKQCFVPYCGNNSLKTPDKVFIATPANIKRRQEWYRVVSNAYNWPFRVLAFSHCCEDHFDPITDFENWMEFKTVGTRLKLRSNVLPHIFKEKPEENTPDIAPFIEILTNKRKMDNLDHECDTEEEPSTSKILKQLCNVPLQTNIQLENVEVKTEFINNSSTNVSPSNEMYESSAEQSTADVVIFPTISICSKMCSNSETESRSSSESDYCTIKRCDVGLSKEHYFLVNLLSKEINCPYIDVLNTLKKIRLNDQFDSLTGDFSLPKMLVQKIFISTLPKISELLKQFIIWPERSKTLVNLPVQYRNNFKNVQSVIKFFEIYIDKPTTSANQLLTWSKHKNGHTMKYFISVNPGGLINFISPGYGGGTCPIEIIKNCGYLDVLPHNITILGDKNLIKLSTVLAVKKCKFVTSVTANADASTLIRQINTTICKLREFQILKLNNRIEECYIPVLDFIVIISCGLVNLQKPLNK